MPNIPDLIRKARKAFLDSNTSQTSTNSNASIKQLYGPVKIFTLDIDGIVYRVFGVKKEDQGKINFAQLRNAISQEMGFKTSKDFLQFIGDSGCFSKEGTKFGKKYIVEELEKQDKESIILYGCTGNSANNGLQADVNKIVSDWVDLNHQQSKRVIGNIVDEGTLTAIEKWGCSIAKNANNFYLVYTDTLEPEAKFGDDVASSDGLTNRKAISLDGGLQTLEQMINLLCRNIPIQGITNLRDIKDVKNYDPSTSLPFISATEFLMHMKNEILRFNSTITQDILMGFAQQYLATHSLYNKNKNDVGMKDALWKKAWEQFAEEGWKKLHLFTYEACPTLLHQVEVSNKALTSNVGISMYSQNQFPISESKTYESIQRNKFS